MTTIDPTTEASQTAEGQLAEILELRKSSSLCQRNIITNLRNVVDALGFAYQTTGINVDFRMVAALEAVVREPLKNFDSIEDLFNAPVPETIDELLYGLRREAEQYELVSVMTDGVAQVLVAF